MKLYENEVEDINNKDVGDWLFDEEPERIAFSTFCRRKRLGHATITSLNKEEFEQAYRYLYRDFKEFYGPSIKECHIHKDYEWTFIYHKGVVKIGKTKPYAYFQREGDKKRYRKHNVPSTAVSI